MPNIEKVSIALPSEMLEKVREAVEAGEYTSSSEVVRDALRSWSQDREFRGEHLEYLRAAWARAMEDKSPGSDPDEVFDRIQRKLAEQAK
ncbi:MAG: type II toxin-antitoxin system ParD family antitoxin [Acidobacteria bacterium]|nr:type II toxin-antitoxin system ParD family antitoxin [Acidobacteriota bacterium]